jgi:protein SCO1/2
MTCKTRHLMKLAVATMMLVTPAIATSAHAQGFYRQPETSLASGTKPDVIKDVDFEQKLNAQVPLDVPFRDETGRTVQLHDYFHHDRPVVLALVYYECPMLCTYVLNGMVTSLKVLRFTAGRDFDVVAISFNPKETAALARDKKKAYMDVYGRSGTADGFHFLTGDESSIEQVTSAVGFKYKFDPRIQQYAHAAGLTLLTPEGRISRYFYGIEFAPKDVQLGLIDASQMKIGTLTEKINFLCYHYDATTGKYGLMVTRLLQIGGIMTMAAFGTFWWMMLRRERRKAYAS